MPEFKDVIAAIESGGDLRAVRFEPAVYKAVENGKYSQALERARFANKCSEPTGMMICSTSWGKFQIMGFVLYGDFGYGYRIYDFLNNVAEQDFMFGSFLERYKIEMTFEEIFSDDNKRMIFATRYNGPQNPVRYAAKMVDMAYRLKYPK